MPSFGGFWTTSAWRALSMSKSVVDVAPAKLFVYAEPATFGLVPAPGSPGA